MNNRVTVDLASSGSHRVTLVKDNGVMSVQVSTSGVTSMSITITDPTILCEVCRIFELGDWDPGLAVWMEEGGA